MKSLTEYLLESQNFLINKHTKDKIEIKIVQIPRYVKKIQGNEKYIFALLDTRDKKLAFKERANEPIKGSYDYFNDDTILIFLSPMKHKNKFKYFTLGKGLINDIDDKIIGYVYSFDDINIDYFRSKGWWV